MRILDLVFPKICLGCGKEGRYICGTCLAKVPRAKLVCPYCEKASIDGMTHAKCKRVYGLDGLVSVWSYDGVVRKAILALKYKYATEIANELSSWLANELAKKKEVFPKNSILAPIPLFWYKGNFRGFNQSEIIGKEVARKFDWKFIPDILVRKKSGTPQAMLKGDARYQNIRGAFALNPDYLSNHLVPSAPVLFDDVFTTGSTLKEAASVLKRKGAKSVWGLTIAR